jgi:hypothetical protein
MGNLVSATEPFHLDFFNEIWYISYLQTVKMQAEVCIKSGPETVILKGVNKLLHILPVFLGQYA